MAGKFPIEYAQTLPTGRAAVARADLDVRTGAEEEARALAHLGGALFGVGQKIHNANKAMELSTFKRQEEEFRLGALQTLKEEGFDVNNDEAVAALRDKTKADRDALVSRWRTVNNAYQIYRNDIDPQWKFEFDGAVLDIKAANVKDEFNLNGENLLGKGKMLEYQTLLETALTTEVITKAEYEFYTKNAPNDSILQQMRIQARSNNPQLAIELSEQLIDPTADQMQYRDRLLALCKTVRVQEVSAEQSRLLTLWRQGKLTEDVIRTSKLAEFGSGSKETFYTKLDAHNKAILAEKEEPFTESDPVVKAKVLERIRAGTIDETEISDLAGVGLSVDDADRFITRMEFFKSFWFRRTDTFFKSQMGWDGAYEKFMHPAGGLAYKLASDELFIAIETEKLRGKAVYDRGTLIAVPYIVDYWENVLMLKPPKVERLKKMLIGEIEPEITPTKRPSPVRIKSVVDPKGIF